MSHRAFRMRLNFNAHVNSQLATVAMVSSQGYDFSQVAGNADGWASVTMADSSVSAEAMVRTSSSSDPFCKRILYEEIAFSRVRIWDLAILIPNVLFLVFLGIRFNRAILKLRATSSPIFLTFYGLVIANIVISVIRCCVSMTVNAATVSGEYADKILWISVRFFLLATEMSVVVFGLAFGHLDSRSSIRHVLLVTSFISLGFSISQAVLEMMSPDEHFHVDSKDYNLFGHGGMLFWFASSIVFTFIYMCILILPWTKLRDRLALPTKRSFYTYIFLLCLLNGMQSLGSGLLLYELYAGLCIVDVTTYAYFTLLTPLVYYAFLSEFFGVSQPSIMFSYKAQVDDHMEDDTVSLPHQQSFSSLKTDSDYIYQNNSVYNSTQLDANTPINPLYAASLQSPDSITGYSIDSCQSLDVGPISSGYQRTNM